MLSDRERNRTGTDCAAEYCRFGTRDLDQSPCYGCCALQGYAIRLRDGQCSRRQVTRHQYIVVGFSSIIFKDHVACADMTNKGQVLRDDKVKATRADLANLRLTLAVLLFKQSSDRDEFARGGTEVDMASVLDRDIHQACGLTD